jgi:mannitol-specific phosphotransferase system IIBC component
MMRYQELTIHSFFLMKKNARTHIYAYKSFEILINQHTIYLVGTHLIIIHFKKDLSILKVVETHYMYSMYIEY